MLLTEQLTVELLIQRRPKVSSKHPPTQLNTCRCNGKKKVGDYDLFTLHELSSMQSVGVIPTHQTVTVLHTLGI